jgi:hypothetical protein
MNGRDENILTLMAQLEVENDQPCVRMGDKPQIVIDVKIE